jgi:cytochrome b pre-mRNA-processing protein 3
LHDDATGRRFNTARERAAAMLNKLFGRARTSRRAAVDAIYERIVAAARQTVFYAEWNVPDTPLGRYEMVSLHIFLFLHRLQPEGQAAREVAQDVTDQFFQDVEHSLRELGIGDMGVPKRMKKLARMFYGRAGSYGAAIDAGDREELAAALGRNIMPSEQERPSAGVLADYVLAASRQLATTPTAEILAGDLLFPEAGVEEMQ